MWGSHGGEYRIMWHCMVWWIGANSTEEPAAFICSTVAREGVEAAVTYWGLSNRICYITLQQWHNGACPTEYAMLHCNSDILEPFQQSMLDYTVTVIYWALASRVHYITVWKWLTGACPTEYAMSHCDSDILGPVWQIILHHTAAVMYWGLSNAVHYITMWKWHIVSSSTKYATSHCNGDILGFV